jgi:myosin heavy subunit
MENQLLVDEGIQLPSNYSELVSFSDNVLCLELIEKRSTGVFSLLNDELAIPKGTDIGFVQKLHHQHAVETKHKHYSKPRVTAASAALPAASDPALDFVIHHYASSITYSAANFLDKNRSKLNDEVLGMFQESKVGMMKAIFSVHIVAEEDAVNGVTAPDGAQRRGTTVSPPAPSVSAAHGRRASTAASSSSQSTKPTSLASQFSASLSSLLASINSSSSHFIRCVKPNANKSASEFDVELVYQQMRNNGMMDVVKQRQEQMKREREGHGGGYSERIMHQTFVERFRCIGYHAHMTTVRKKGQRSTALPKVTPFSAESSDLPTSVSSLLKLLDPISPPPSSAVAKFLPPFQVGKTRVFLTAACLASFESARTNLLDTAAVRIQKVAKGFLARRRWKRKIRAHAAVQLAIRRADLSALDAALVQAKSVGLDRKLLASGERARAGLAKDAATKKLIDLALNEKAATLEARMALCQYAVEAAVSAQIIDAHGVTIVRTNATPAITMLQKQANFVYQYDAILRKLSTDLRHLLQRVITDQSAVPTLGHFLTSCDGELTSILPASMAPSSLGLASNLSLTQLRALSSSEEVTKATQRHKQLQALACSFAEAQKNKALDQMTALAQGATEKHGVQWAEFRVARFQAQARQLEQDTQAALHALVPSQLKQALAPLQSTLNDADLCRELDTCFSSPSVTVRSLAQQVESALEQVKAESAAEEVLKKAIKKGDLDAIQLAVTQAEQTIKQREDNLSPPPSVDSAASPLSHASRSLPKRMQLDDLLTAAFLDLTRLNRIRECSLQLKSLGVELDDEQRISAALQAAIEAGVPKEETEPFARRLREVETRLQLQRAMEAKDIPTLEQAIQSAEKRLAKNEMEVRWE